MSMGPESWGVIGALVVVIGWVLRHLASQRRDFLAFLANHMSPLTKAINRLEKTLVVFNERTRDCAKYRVEHTDGRDEGTPKDPAG